ncbi:hypothetical protein BsWGS_13478 [Bradybaena similaris]
MSDAATPAAPAAAPTKVAKKKPASSKAKGPSAHPQYKVMIAAAVNALKERGGSSRQAILKYIIANYKVGNNPTAINARLKAALKAGVKAGNLKQSKGTGAAGSFRLGDKSEKVKKEGKAKSPKKKAAKSPKKAGEAKKPKAAKKTVKKAAAAKKPKSPKKKAAKPKKAKSPKKAAAKPKAAKPKVAKKPAAKKVKTPKKAAAK